MINIKNAKEVFKEYVNKYDAYNGKVALKISHILRVSEISKNIAQKNNLTKEEQDLAELIGLLHDIGRFEQVKLYNTFVDVKSVNHAELGVKILFEDGLIRKFIDDTKYDNIIKSAILNHNRGDITANISEEELKFSKIIRDADKVDIFHVLVTEELEDIYGCSDFSEDLITKEIFEEFCNNKRIDYKNRKTTADIWVSHMAYIYDFNFDYCLRKIKDEGYIEKLLKRVNFKNKETIYLANEIVRLVNEYMVNTLKQ